MPVEGVVPPSVGRFSNLIKVVEVINPRHAQRLLFSWQLANHSRELQ